MSSPPPHHEPARLDVLGIVGVGLIGGSIAAAARQRGLTQRIIGVGRTLSRLETARSQGLIDHATNSIRDLADATCVIVCTPVDRLADDIREVACIVGADTLITDVGSVKSSIVRTVMADTEAASRSEKSGFEHASPTLFDGRVCVVTPAETTPPELVERAEALWSGIGMTTRRMSPDRHDRVLAVTSHLPHLAAAAVASLPTDEELEFAASGFRDTTRIAAGDARLWQAIFSSNREHMLAATDELIDLLQRFSAAIRNDNADALIDLLDRARQHRELFSRLRQAGRENDGE
ncbi:Cyclohexadienyl dehydrogenase (Arogenate dehydrogenase) (ADH) (Prephenate dehydrogenase) (PDH) [Durusdinium trenchii]|uniref:Cyclohexadienyl dehydrogenase (Arogenate dehydrogenase) (ADH) (Prephenate dehydrogenase) (PDH) n=1 Tax=Durusdinium trenchii TaxID=1381693 RepID=A0ABP0KAA3_9DINO